MTTAEAPPLAEPNQRPWQFSLLKLLVWFAALGVLLALGRGGWIAVSGAREAGRCSACLGHHKQLALALHNYHDDWGSFPPAYTTDANGKPMHSWRVLILPYMYPELAAQYNLAEPWNGPNNIKLASMIPNIYLCPSCQLQSSIGETNYVAVVGPGTAWPGFGARTLADCLDKNALLIVETHGSGICWLEPRDLELGTIPLELNSATKPAISSPHPGRVNYSTVDGQVKTLLEGKVTPAQLKALLTTADDD